MSLLKLILIALFLLFPLGQIARFQLENGISFVLNDVIVVGIFFIWLIDSVLNKKLPSRQLLKPILIFVSIAFISLIINSKFISSQEFFISFLYLLRWSAYISLYFIVKNFDIKFKKAVTFVITFAGAVVVFLGYAQYLLYPNLRNLYYLGWDEHLHRMFSTFLDPNFAGAFFVLYLLFLIGLIFKYQELKNRSKAKIIMLIFLLISTTAAVFLTYSRSALIMLFFGILTFLVIKHLKKWIILVILLFLIFLTLNSKNSYIENMNLFRVVSSEARIKSAAEAINIIGKNPILGVGFNAYRYTQIRYGFRSGTSALNSHADAGTDNSFLFVLATTGAVGFISYMYVWFSFFKTGVNKTQQSFKWLAPVIISSIVGIFINSLFINSLFYPFLMMWMFSILGLKESK